MTAGISHLLHFIANMQLFLLLPTLNIIFEVDCLHFAAYIQHAPQKGVSVVFHFILIFRLLIPIHEH